MSRRLSLPQGPISNPPFDFDESGSLFALLPLSSDRRQIPFKANSSLTCLSKIATRHNGFARCSQPDLCYSYGIERVPDELSNHNRQRLIRAPKNHIHKRYLKSSNYSDLAIRLQKYSETHEHNNDNATNQQTEAAIDPVYLALKQATGRYGGRRVSSANNFDSASPSPRNLSQVSLQDSGYAEMSSVRRNPMLGSTPQLDNSGRSGGRRRAPKLTTQMKSLSLDCQEMPPRINAANRSPLRTKIMSGNLRRKNGSSDLSDWDRSCSPCNGNSRKSSVAPALTGGHIVIHEYAPPNAVTPLVLGERVYVVDNGDPDWLHGFREHDRTERLITFPATCVAVVQPGEQAMKILQNLSVPEIKLRLYRDQVVFAQPDSLHDGKVTIRTAHQVYAPCPLSSLALV